MLNKTLEELNEILPEGELTLVQFNSRLSKGSLKKFEYIQGMLQTSNIGRLSKQATLEYIIKNYYAIICEQPRAKSYAEQLIREHKEGKRV